MTYYRNFASFLGIYLFTAAAGWACIHGDTLSGVDLSGLIHTRPLVVERLLQHKTGIPYSESIKDQEIRSLQDLDLFAEIQVHCTPSSPRNQVLHYQFLEMFQYLPAPSLKQTDQDGWMLGGALAALNVLGLDIRLEVQARATVNPWLQAKEYALYGSSPWLGSIPLDWNIDITQTDSWDPLRQFHDQSLHGTLKTLYRLNHPWNILGQLGFRKVDHQDQQNWLSSTNMDWVPRLGGGLIVDTRDAKLDSRKGMFHEWSFTQYGGILGGPANYREWIWDAQANWSSPIGLWKGSWLLRYRPGTLGFYDRLHHGGANTLRAYDPDWLVYGNHEFLSNLEYRADWVKRKPVRILGVQGYYALQWVAGADGALLWNHGTPDSSEARSSLYTGFHLVIPAIDRLRAEIGFSPKDRVWNISVGLFEKTTTQRWRAR